MNTAFAQKIDAVIESLTPELVAYSKQLISFPTVAGQEQGAGVSAYHAGGARLCRGYVGT